MKKLFPVLAIAIVAGLLVWSFRFNRNGQKNLTAVHSSTPTAAAASPKNSTTTTTASAAPVSEMERHGQIIGTQWAKESDPKLRAFFGWAEKFLAADAGGRVTLLPEGIVLAQARRVALKQLIESNPERALAVAVPMAVRTQLPAEVSELLEERVSARGDLYTLGATPAPGQSAARPYSQVAEFSHRFLDAFTYGDRKARQFEYRRAQGIHGIAVDASLAVLDSSVRVLETGEPLPVDKTIDPICSTSGLTTPATPGNPLSATSASVAVDNGDSVTIVCRHAHVNWGTEAQWQVLASGGASPAPTPGTASLSKPSTNLCLGVHRSLFIRVDSSDMPDSVTNFTPESVVNAFERPGGVDDWYIRNSHGLASNPMFVTNVTPVYRLPNPMAYYKTNAGSGPLHSDARALAQAAGYNVTNYQHIYVLHPSSYQTVTPTNFANKLDYAGLGSVGGPNIWMNGNNDFYVIAHEAGHNFGLLHANRWAPTNNLPLGDAAALSTLPAGYSAYNAPTGLSIEYGDANDMMAYGPDSRYWINPYFATYVSWLPDATAPGVGDSGVYRIFRYDHQDADTNKIFAIKVERDGVKDYWIAYRRQFVGDANKTIGNGAYIFFGYKSYRQNDWVKMDAVNWALLPGQTLSDTNVGVAFTTLAQGGSGLNEYIDVRVQLTPQIEWANTNLTVSPNSGSLALTLTRTRDFSGAFTANFVTEDITATAGSDYTGVTNSVSWAAGERGDKTISVSVLPTATVGKQFRVRLTSVPGGITLRSPTATVTFGTDAGGLVGGGLWRQFYSSISGAAISNLMSSAKFPNTPDSTSVVTNGETVANIADNYGQRLVGFITAPLTANYKFWASGDDVVQVFLGTNASPASKSSIISTPTYTSARVYSYGSASIALTAGQKYYFEVLHKEGGGSDNLAIAWRTNLTAQPANSSEPIPGSVLSYVAGGDIAPRVTTQPVSQLAGSGGSVTFAPAVVGATPLAYQWRLGGTNISSATNFTFTKVGLTGGDAGNYDVVVTNNYGSVTSSIAVLTIGNAPVITNQPASQSLGTFQNLSLNVGASGNSLMYQWRFNGDLIGFATNSSLFVPQVQSGQAGNYDVVIANDISSVTSAVAVVSIGATPVVTNQPVSLAVNPGGFAQFSVAVSGATPLAYQWRKNGTNISSANFSSLALANATTNDAGNFAVVVSNAFGVVTSSVALLSVTTAGNVAAGGLWLDYFGGITVTNTVNPPMSDLTNNVAYPNSPTSSGVINSFETSKNRGVTYGQHITGYVLPPVTGNYRFMLAADQAGQLFLSTNDLAANKQLIASNPQRVGYRSWESEQLGASSALIPLVAGQKYFVEVLHVNPDFDPYQGYIDNLGVAWQTPLDAASPHIGDAPIPGNYLAYDQRTFAAPGITTQPATQLIPLGGTANFSVIASNATGYVWRKNGVAIPGANNASYVISGVTNSDIASYDVLVGGAGGTVASSVASLVIGGIPGSTLNSNLVAYLTFDADYLDYSGRQNHPSLVNTNSRTAGFLGAGSYALTNSGYLSFGLAPDLHFNNDTVGNTNSFSVSFWAKIPANSYTGAPPFLANKDWSADANTGWALASGPGTAGNGFFTMQFKENNANSRRYDSLTTSLTNGWHHYLTVFQRNGTRTCFTYIDGALADSRTMFASGIGLDLASLPLNLGQDGTGIGTRGRWNNGAQMDDFALWRRALTTTDVTAIYSAGTNGYALAYAEAAPVITNFPASFTLPSGSNLSLTVGVISVTKPGYQWRLNGTNISAATNATYLKTAPAATNFGSYDVIVTNLYGSTASAVVVVSPPAPAIGLVNAISYTGGNAVTLNFAGTAGVSYDVQRSTNLVSWATIWTTNAPVGGLFNFTDNFIGNAPRQAFYRLTWLP